MTDARGIKVNVGDTAIVIKSWGQQKSGGDVVIAEVKEDEAAAYFHNSKTGRLNKVHKKELYIVPALDIP